MPEPPPWMSVCHRQCGKLGNELPAKKGVPKPHSFRGDGGNPRRRSQTRASRESGRLDRGKRDVWEHSLRNGPRGSGGISTRPTYCTKKQKNQLRQSKIRPAAARYSSGFFLSHPAPCEQKVSLGWECGMLEIKGNGNLLCLPCPTLACCNRPLSPRYLH